MKQQEFDNVVNETIQDIQKLLRVKGGEYAGSEDRLANFKRGAQLTGCSPLQVLFIYLSKHYDSVATYVRDQANGTDRERSESITSRLDDIINYCILAKGLIEEDKGKTQNISLTKAQVEEVKKSPYGRWEYLNEAPKGVVIKQILVKDINVMFDTFHRRNQSEVFARISGMDGKWIKVWDQEANFSLERGIHLAYSGGAYNASV